jgi:hypothetical protein
MSASAYRRVRRNIKQGYKDHGDFGSQDKIDAWCEFGFLGKVFISHTAPDAEWCEKHIVSMMRREFTRPFNEQSYFFLSKASPEWQSKASETSLPEWQRKLHFAFVESSFKYAKTVIIVVSENSRQSDWMSAESRWAIKQKHPIIICLRDRIDPTFLRKELRAFPPDYVYAGNVPVRVVDFSGDPDEAGQALLTLLRMPEFRPEFMDLPFGTTPIIEFQAFYRKRVASRGVLQRAKWYLGTLLRRL